MEMLTYSVLSCGAPACSLHKSQFGCLDFAIMKSALRKTFDTRSKDVVDVCRGIFNCSNVELVIATRIDENSWQQISCSENVLYRAFAGW